MITVRVSNRSRLASAALAAVLMLFLVGDRAAFTAIPGIDPLDVLDLAVKNNVLFIIDTSSSMSGTIEGNHDVGGDDPAGRFYQTKRAVREVIRESAGIANFGLATFHPEFEEHRMRAATATSGAPVEGPLYYVSQDAAADTWRGFFDDPTNYASPNPPLTLTDYDQTTSLDVFKSFRTNSFGFGAAYPSGCVNNAGPTPGPTHTYGTHCRYYIRSLLLRDNVQYTWNRNANPKSGGLTATASPIPGGCPNPPAGLLGDDVAAFNDGTKKRACFQIKNSQGGAIATYFFTSANFSFTNVGAPPTSNCAQTGINMDVAPCTADTSQTIQDLMRLELQIDPNTGQPIDVPFFAYPTTATVSLDNRKPHNPAGSTTFLNTGIRQGNGTPLAASLSWALGYFQNTVFPSRPAAVVGKQKNFVILLTDGAESCVADNPPGARDAATTAAASALYDLTPSADNRVETFVIVFAESVSSANRIARAGSGNTRDAYTALNLSSLIQSLKDAIALASTSGTFSAQPSITESVFELGPVLTPAVDPLDPKTRYTADVPVLFQSTFDMPSFKGHVKAFRNASGTSLEVWDAGQKLLDRVTAGINTCTRTVNSVKACLFSELHNGATEANVGTIARIKRRIYTTSRNNLDAVTPTTLIDRTANQTNRVALWPPNTSTSGVAPADNQNSPGSLDGPLGLANLTEQDLKNQFKACVGSNLPGNCTSANATTRLQQHWREAREMMLAFAAGAQTIPDANGNPARDATAKQLLYKARPWILAESTISAPAVVTPPLQSKPIIHVDEYELLRDGPRNASNQSTNGILQGFGLRNPDDDNQATSKSDTNLKPAMTVVYHGANDMLHAFRGAPCPSSTLPCAGETGGEELWAFVPFDQLGKLASLMKTQTRSTKTYVIASPVRFADVFVPGTFSTSVGGTAVTGTGVWRTLLYFGRGIGGKYYTALDVTVPGPLTRHSINNTGASTDLFAPIPVWSRGNPDTSDGKLKSLSNAFNNPNLTAGLADYDAYLRMGETWSVPAIATVNASENTTPRTAGGVEFVAYVGSGYGASGEGTTFYALDALTGDVIAKSDVDLATTPPATTIFTPNALVASPAVFSPNQLKADFIGNPAGEKATRVYIGDVYGRLWKFLPKTANTGFPAILMQDFGVQQTIGNAVALLNLDTDGTPKPHIFLETGRDNRVTPPPAATPPFKLLGLRDDASDSDVTTPQSPTVLFTQDFPGPNPAPPPAQFRFRGTSQPATTFNTEKKGRVFFVGTQFNPIDVNCISSFDSILFALTAGTGQAAYDLGLVPGQPAAYTTFTGEKITGPQVVGGKLVLDKGIGADTAPLPPALPKVLPPPAGTQGDVYLGSNIPATTLPGATPFRVGSIVCQP